MPKRSRANTQAKKRKAKRQDRGINLSNTSSGFGVLMNKPILGYQKRTKLVYFETGLSLNSTAGVPGFQNFSVNSCYDPYTTGTGHQPMGFDQMMALYRFYTVLGSTITVKFRSGDSTYLNYVGIFATGDTTTVSAPGDIIENGDGISSSLSPKPASGSDSTAECVLTYKVDMKQITRQKNLIGQDEYSGRFNSNPTDQYYYRIWAAPNTAVNSSCVCDYVRIEYDVVFHGLVTTTAS